MQEQKYEATLKLLGHKLGFCIFFDLKNEKGSHNCVIHTSKNIVKPQKFEMKNFFRFGINLLLVELQVQMKSSNETCRGLISE